MEDAAREKIIDRVRKVLAYATSDNPHEAANAAAAAARLMAKHGIESVESAEIEADPVSDNIDVYVEIGTSRRPVAWKWNVAWVVGTTAQCMPYMLHRKTGETIHALMVAFIGRRSDAELCAYLYDHLLKELKRLHDLMRPPTGRKIQQYIPGTPATTVDPEFRRRWSRDFYHGAVAVLSERMNKARQEVLHTASATALVRLDTVLEKVEATTLELGLQYVKARLPTVNSQYGYAAGERAGRDLDLSSNAPKIAGPDEPT